VGLEGGAEKNSTPHASGNVNRSNGFPSGRVHTGGAGVLNADEILRMGRDRAARRTVAERAREGSESKRQIRINVLRVTRIRVRAGRVTAARSGTAGGLS